MTPLDRLEAALTAAGCDPRRRAEHIAARCPTHDDRRPSLKIDLGDDGSALVCCQAGCSTDDVVAKIGLRMADLFVTRSGTPWSQPRQVVATYPYRDEHGADLYRVVRSEPKSFRMEAPDGNGGWRTGRECMAGIRRTLYRLPEVVEAVRAGEPVFIVEGEKDADRLVEAGVCATTVAGGAGKWGSVSDAAGVLAGAQVVVVVDRDEAGWRHALQVIESIQAIASVRVVASITGKDAADHLTAGYRVDQFIDVDPTSELTAIREADPGGRDTFALLSRRVIRCGEDYCLHDACVRLYAVVDEAPGRIMSGRNEIAAALGWTRPAKVTEHAAHLVEAGLFDITEHPSGGGHKATVYRVVYNPARKGTVGLKRSTVPSELSATSTEADPGPSEPPVAHAVQPRVGLNQPTSPTAVVRQRPTAILSTLGMSNQGAKEEKSASDQGEAARTPEKEIREPVFEQTDPCRICGAPPPRRSSFGWLACRHQIVAGLMPS